MLAHITQDEALTEVFRRGEDLHTATACRVFGVAADQVTREMRRMAKVVNFSIPYGTNRVWPCAAVRFHPRSRGGFEAKPI